MCEDDPSLKTPGAKQEFLKAFNDAISQLEDKTNAYITGYNAGVQVLLKGVQLDKYFDIHLNPGMVGYGIAYALSDNTDRTKIQSEGNPISTTPRNRKPKLRNLIRHWPSTTPLSSPNPATTRPPPPASNT